MVLWQIVGAVLVLRDGKLVEADEKDTHGFRVEQPTYTVNSPPFHFTGPDYTGDWYKLVPVTRCVGFGWLSDEQLKRMVEPWDRPKLGYVYSGNVQGAGGSYAIYWDGHPPIPVGTQGWRADATTEPPGFKFVVVTYDAPFGWLTEEERFALRQTEPRLAP